MAMFYTQESKTPSVGSSDSGDGNHGQNARSLSSILDLQKQRGVGGAILTITGKAIMFEKPKTPQYTETKTFGSLVFYNL